MAEPIFMYTPQRDVQEELRRKLPRAPADHADALLAAYELLQEAQDHGVLDTLRGAIGAGETIIGKASEYANTPEGIRLMRNLLAMGRLLGELDPAMLDAATKAASHSRRKVVADTLQPSWFEILRRLTGAESRRAMARMAEFSASLGGALNAGQSRSEDHSVDQRPARQASGVAIPVVFSAVLVMLAAFWIARRTSSR